MTQAKTGRFRKKLDIASSYFPAARLAGTTPACAGAGPSGTSTAFTATPGLTWSRPLSEITNLTAYARYGISSADNRSGDTNNYLAGAALTHLINPGLTGSLSYRVSYREGGGLSDAVLQNIIVAAVRQTF